MLYLEEVHLQICRDRQERFGREADARRLARAARARRPPARRRLAVHAVALLVRGR